MRKFLWARRSALFLFVAFLLASTDSAEGAPNQLHIQAGRVSIDGQTTIKVVSKEISGSGVKGEGSLLLQDDRHAMMIGTSTQAGSGPGQRIMPLKGDGFRITSKTDGSPGGIFVAAADPPTVGIHETDGVNFKKTRTSGQEHLHVNGDFLTTDLSLPKTGAPAIVTAHAEKLQSQHDAILLPNDGGGREATYALGRGKLSERMMTMKVPSMGHYSGSGAPPIILYHTDSDKGALAAFKAAKAEGAGSFTSVYLAKNLCLGADAEGAGKLACDFGQDADDKYKDIYVKQVKGDRNDRGVINVADPSGKTAVMSYPSKANKFVFRTAATANAAATTNSLDTKLYIGQKKDKPEEMAVGVNTEAPTSTLDVRGHMFLQNSRGDTALVEGAGAKSAVVYFPQSGQGLRIKAKDPKASTEATRFFIATNGRIGINTEKPAHGICLDPNENMKAEVKDMGIKHGDLYVRGAMKQLLKDTNRALSLDDRNDFKDLHLESGLVVANPEDKATEADDPKDLRVQGKSPILKIYSKLNHPVAKTDISLRAGDTEWKMQGTKTDFNITHTKLEGNFNIFFTPNQHLVLGHRGQPLDEQGKPTDRFAMQLESARPPEPGKGELVPKPADDIYVHGDLRLAGAIAKRGIWYNKTIYWKLEPKRHSVLKDIAISTDGSLQVGPNPYPDIHKQKIGLRVERGLTIDIGSSGFMYSKSEGNDVNRGTISFNEYISKEQKFLQYKDKHAAAIRLDNNGIVEFEGTAEPGVLKMSKLMVLDPSSKNQITFEKYADFGTQAAAEDSSRYPLRIVGGQCCEVGNKPSAVAFGSGQLATFGVMGATDKFVFIGSQKHEDSGEWLNKASVKPFGMLAIQQKDGKVGVGATLHDTLNEHLSVKTQELNADVYMTSKQFMCEASESKPQCNNMNNITLRMESQGSLKLSSTTGKYQVEGYTAVEFVNSGADNKATVFERNNTVFASGNVGWGVDTAEKKLHVGGDLWSQGRLYFFNGLASEPVSETLSLIEEGEGTGKEKHAQHASKGLDVGQAVIKLARLVRKNKQRLRKQAMHIERMESTMARLAQSRS